MHVEETSSDVLSADPARARRGPAAVSLEPWTPRELRAVVHAGDNDSDAVERLLVRLARMEGALDLAIGDGLAAISEGAASSPSASRPSRTTPGRSST